MTKTHEKHSVPVLVVDDNIDDFLALQRGMRKRGMNNPVFHCSNGDDAMDYLNHRNQFSDQKLSPRPSVVLLDLNMPGTDGVDVLQQIKGNPHLRKIPVLMHSTSSDPSDVDRCYESGANSYVQKSVDESTFMDSIERLGEFWFGVVLLPRIEGP